MSKFSISNKRMICEGVVHHLVENKINDNQYDIECIKFNFCSDSLNESFKYLNQYLDYKFVRFKKPSISDENLKKILESANQKLIFTKNNFRKVSTKDERMVSYISNLESNILKIEPILESEKIFLNKYINTKKFFRRFLIY